MEGGVVSGPSFPFPVPFSIIEGVGKDVMGMETDLEPPLPHLSLWTCCPRFKEAVKYRGEDLVTSHLGIGLTVLLLSTSLHLRSI